MEHWSYCLYFVCSSAICLANFHLRLFGNYPFDSDNDAVVIQNILSANYSFPEDTKVSEAGGYCL